MKLVRLPRSPSSVSGVLPAEKIIGTLRREAFITAADALPGADDHVHHDDLRLARNHGIALSHAYRDKLMRHCDRHRDAFLLGGELRQTVDDRPKVGAAVAEKIFDPASAQDFQISLADGLDR